MITSGHEQRQRGCLSYLLIVAAVILALALTPAACVAMFDKAQSDAGAGHQRPAPATAEAHPAP